VKKKVIIFGNPGVATSLLQIRLRDEGVDSVCCWERGEILPHLDDIGILCVDLEGRSIDEALNVIALIQREKPKIPVLAMTDNSLLARRLPDNVVWGIDPNTLTKLFQRMLVE